MELKRNIKYNLELNINEMKILRDIMEAFSTNDTEMDTYAEELYELLIGELCKL